MPQQIKSLPVKFCLNCGKKLDRKQFNGRLEDFAIFSRRKYCSRECSWICCQRDSISLSGAYKRAAKYRASVCAVCTSTKHLGIHHKDRNPLNNSIGNLVTLCASCHTKLHWKEDKKPRLKANCKVCGKPAKKLGFCQKHLTTCNNFGKKPYPRDSIPRDVGQKLPA